MENVEPWIKLLYTYGPFALLVFFVFVTENKARTAMKEAANGRNLSLLIVYLLNWGAIFCLLAFALYVWTRINLPSEPSIRGSFEDLTSKEQVSSKRFPFYLHALYEKDGDKGRYDLEWRLITQSKLKDGEKVRFTFARGERITDHIMKVRSSFYTDKVRVIYDRKQDMLFLLSEGIPEELPPTQEVATSAAPSIENVLIPTAYAQEAFPSNSFKERLESYDPIIRRDARGDLANYKQAALPWIQEVLVNKDNSYRLHLGVISALNKMPKLKFNDLRDSAFLAIIEDSAASDPTLRGEARRFLVSHANGRLEAQVANLLSEARKQSTGSNSNPRTIELALTELDVLYNVGVSEKDQYGGRNPGSREHLEKAIAAFQKAWELRPVVPPKDRIVFAKALYGWGLVLHDRSWLERRPDGTREPTLVKAAQEKFREFLSEVQRMKDSKGYPYPQHLKNAAAYLQKPEPESLT